MFQYLFEPEIRRMLVNFYTISGIRVGIHDPEMNILTEYPVKSSEYEKLRFCDKARFHSESYTEKCRRCDLEALEHIRATKKAYIYSCHLGFMEALIPIIAGGEIICALMIGQVRPKKPEGGEAQRIQSFLGCCGIDEGLIPSLMESYGETNLLEPEKFEALAYFLEICAQSIYDNRWIRREEKSIAENFVDYVRKNLYNNISVGQAAAALNISVSHLSRVIASELGVTFTEYLTASRMEIAKKLLRSTGMTINEIALYLRYDEPTYFMRLFKRHTGLTCGEYRASGKDFGEEK